MGGGGRAPAAASGRRQAAELGALSRIAELTTQAEAAATANERLSEMSGERAMEQDGAGQGVRVGAAGEGSSELAQQAQEAGASGGEAKAKEAASSSS